MGDRRQQLGPAGIVGVPRLLQPATARQGDDVPEPLRYVMAVAPDDAIDHETHGRPASRSALKFSESNALPFSVRARARIRSTAARASDWSILASFGTNRATGLPCRVIKISSPRSTRSSS